jgi:hypothetical protein
MSDGSVKPLPLSNTAQRLVLLAGLVALGTGCSLWLIAAWLAPRDRRVPEGSPVVEVTVPQRKDFSPLAVVSRRRPVHGWEVLPAEQADHRLRDDEMLLAVEINGEARCWPLNVMTGPQREVFNDQLGGRNIAATW